MLRRFSLVFETENVACGFLQLRGVIGFDFWADGL